MKNPTLAIRTTIITAALGYFVDIYDLVLFSIVRQESLKGIGIPENQWLDVGVFLLNMQMTGMLLGGIIWGIIGDKRGRVSVLFGSIFLYSIANILNAFVGGITSYGVLRLVAGIGLAGELGAAITLVSEIMSKEKRGYGATVVASVGICGAVLAAVIGDKFSWQTAYIVGGVLGLALLALRFGIYESGMYSSLIDKKVKKGNPILLFNSWSRFRRYLRCILIGLPIWYVIGNLVTFSPELAKEIGVEGKVSAGTAIMFCYIGLALGDLSSGVLSQLLRTRKKVLLYFMILTALSVAYYIYVGKFFQTISVSHFYFICSLLGFATGYWAVFVTIASEQFGTNIRATVTTTVPNFVRGSVVPLNLLFRSLAPLGLLVSAQIVGVFVLLTALIALTQLDETFGKNLDYTE